MQASYTIAMIIAKNAKEVPSLFKSCGNGFANDVFEDRHNDIILKIYSKKRYYAAELLAFESGFERMPRLLESGVIGNKNYTAMTRIGSSVKEFSHKHFLSLAETTSILHARKKSKQAPSFEHKFNSLLENNGLISGLFKVKIETVFDRLKSYSRQSNTFSLTHGDITLSNLRNVSGKIFLIDFDEASYFLPIFEIAKLYWSDIVPLQKMDGIKKFTNAYDQFSEYKLPVDQLHDWILFAGIDFWLWRYLNLQNQPLLIQEAQERLLLYRQKEYDPQ